MCRRKELLEDYLADVLRPADRALFEQHVAQCSSCRKALTAALQARECLAMLAPTEAPPEPGPDFFFRVQRSIEKELSGGWLTDLAANMRLRLAYPLVALCLLVVAWSLTVNWTRVDTYANDNGFVATEYPATEFAQMSFRNPDQGRDLVIVSLVGMPEQR